MDRLIIKNFGPLKDVDIELNKVNLFIGENASGKSVLAKLITIILDLKNHDFDENILFQKFQDFYIHFFIKETVIQLFVDDNIIFKIENMQIKTILKLNKKRIETHKLSSQYIPAERNLISLFSKSLSTLLISDIPLPKFLLHFSSHYEKARNEIRELKFLTMKYVNNGKDLIYYNDEDYLDLEHSSSGVQSALPLYLTLKYFANKHNTIVVEEPEQNLFPKAQSETVQYIVGEVSEENNLFIMTHSPYVLSSLNILLYAFKTAQLNKKAKERVIECVPESQWIDPDTFSAYYLENGVSRNIKGRTGLIGENEIDEFSSDIASRFDELLEIYSECKNDS